MTLKHICVQNKNAKHANPMPKGKGSHKLQLIILSLFFVVIALGFGIWQNAYASTTIIQPLTKQWANLFQRNWQNQQNLKSHATKHPNSIPSCPINLNALPWIVNLNGHTLPGQNYTSFIQIISSEHIPFTIYADSHSITVQRDLVDPCAFRATHPSLSQQSIQQNPQYTPVVYTLPQDITFVSFSSAQGDIISMKTTSGQIKQFNYVTGKFLVS